MAFDESPAKFGCAQKSRYSARRVEGPARRRVANDADTESEMADVYDRISNYRTDPE